MLITARAVERLPEPWRACVQLTRIDRPIGSLLLLWPTLAALWIAAEGSPSPLLLLVFTIGVILTRSAGCVVNDIADRNIDGHVARTAARAFPQGRAATGPALVLAGSLFLLAFLLVVVTTNLLTVTLSVGGLAVACLYPFVKRVSHYPQAVLGIAFSWGIPMAFAAQTGAVPVSSWLLFAANMCWIMAYDTQYAMADRADDLLLGVRSTAVRFGAGARNLIVVLQVGMLVFLALFAWGTIPGWGFWVGVAVIIALFARQRTLVQDCRPEECLRAFLENNHVGATLFIAVVAGYLTAGSWP